MPQETNRVIEVFKDKTVLLTGGTGFLGKVLIEKLLRMCPKIHKIYVLVRPKNDKTVDERLKDIFKGPLVRKQEGKSIFGKVKAVAGDLSASDLGLSDENRRKLIEEVEIINHLGASVKFDEPFKSAVLLNVRGTKLMLDLAKECKKLMIFCHVSTAYCHEDEEVLYEKIYQRPSDPLEIIKMCEWMEEADLNNMATNLRGLRANNYTFSKALGEALIEDNLNELPVVLLRPSAVLPVYKDPLPGWSDNINGPTGLLIGAGKGVIRTMYGRGDYFLDYVSVDVVASCLMCAVYDYVTHRTRRIYNITTSDEIKVPFQELIDKGKEMATNKVPFSIVLWYPGGSLTQSRMYHVIRFVLFQLMPAAFCDLILYAIGYKPFLLRVQKKIWCGYNMLEYYCNRQWNFKKENSNEARKLLNAREIDEFNFDISKFDMDQYIEDCIRGARRFILKEDENDLPAAIRRMKILKIIDLLCKISIVLFLIYWAYKYLFEYPFFSTFEKGFKHRHTALHAT